MIAFLTIGLVATLVVAIISQHRELVLFLDDFGYTDSGGYLEKWENEASRTESETLYSDYSLVTVQYSQPSFLRMNLPKGRPLQNKVYAKRAFKGNSLIVAVRFKISSPQNEPNYAIFLYRSDDNGANHQELDWEFSPKGLGFQQFTYFYDNTWPWSPNSIALDEPWNRISSYSEWTILEFDLEPKYTTIHLENNKSKLTKSFSCTSPMGGFDSIDMRLYFETSVGLPSNIQGSYGVEREKRAERDSELLIDWVKISTPNCLRTEASYSD